MGGSSTLDMSVLGVSIEGNDRCCPSLDETLECALRAIRQVILYKAEQHDFRLQTNSTNATFSDDIIQMMRSVCRPGYP